MQSGLLAVVPDSSLVERVIAENIGDGARAVREQIVFVDEFGRQRRSKQSSDDTRAVAVEGVQQAGSNVLNPVEDLLLGVRRHRRQHKRERSECSPLPPLRRRPVDALDRQPCSCARRFAARRLLQDRQMGLRFVMSNAATGPQRPVSDGRPPSRGPRTHNTPDDP